MQDFVHLHVHSQYSILDGQSPIPKIVDKAIANGMRGMALTDHGNMMGIKEFFNYMKKKKSKAREDKAVAEAKMQAVESGNYKPNPAVKEEACDKGKSKEELLADCRKALDKAEAVLRFKPIFGCEMYCAHTVKESREGKTDMSGWHLIVLAKNEQGYHNLIKLVSRAWIDGFYMKPRTDHADLEKYKEGLIVCSACLGGEVPSHIINGERAQAEESVKWFKKVFGDNYYLELQRHEVKDPNQRANRETFPLQEKVNKVLVDFAEKYGIKLVCTNDCHFVNAEDAEAHDRLICLSTNHLYTDRDRMVYTKQEWFKTREEMNEIFSDFPQALQNTCDICDQVEEYSIDHQPIMPNFAIPEDFGTEEEYRKKLTDKDLYEEFTRDENGNVVCTEEEGLKKIKKLGGYDKLYRIKLEADYLAKLTYDGAKQRYGDPLDTEVADRIKFELHVMKTMGFPGYFLIVQDYINAARSILDVSVGPGRGSAAGSAVAYCLGITQIDPIKYDLLFERFLNPDRISLPDIDVDFDDDGRGKVLKWVTDKYGEDKVAHIITYGTMAAKMAIKDVARVQELPLGESNRLCKLIPDRLPAGPDGKVPKTNLKNAIAAIPELQAACNSEDVNECEVMSFAQKLEGSIRSTGVHACGTIICRDDISDWVPISTAEDKITKEKLHCTQYEGSVIEETGLIKMDFLGLSTLSILKEVVENIKESLGIIIDLEKISLEDKATYRLFCDGRTIGVFQFESAGMQKYLRELQPSTFEDLIAMNALYRPGPMQYIPSFIDRKHGREPIAYDLDCMEKYLKDTYGITVYQEQVMLLSREIAGFTRGESDTLRKAMGKKQKDKLDHLYPKFLSGGQARGHDKKTLEKIWSDWEAFASYAFNKSHATCYSWVAYQTAYLKANYPSQCMAGIMSRELSDISEVTKLMADCSSMGIQTLGPDINESRIKFSVNKKNIIRFGLGAIKGIGTAAMENVIDERLKNGTFKDPYDFVERVNLSNCNRKALENLVLSGAFDSFGYKREQYFVNNSKGECFLDELLRYGNNFQRDKEEGATSLFGDNDDAYAITRPEVPMNFVPWNDLDRLNKERDLIGIYLSAHPLDEYYVILNEICNMHCNAISEISAEMVGSKQFIGGIVTNIREGLTKRNKPYGIVTMEDYNGNGELALFGDDWARNKNFFAVGNALFIKGHIEAGYGNRIDLKIDSIEFLADVKDSLISKLTISIPFSELDGNFVETIMRNVKDGKGQTELFLNISNDGLKTRLKLKASRTLVNVNRELLDSLKIMPEVNYQIN